MVQVKITDEKFEPSKTLRIKFKKTGNLQYISHLDLVRTVHKMLVRVKMPLWYTEGFNPKPKMVFSSSMSIGLQSECEFLDVKITHALDLESVTAALNACSTDELVFLSAYYPTVKFTEIRWASYHISIETENPPENLAVLCKEVLAGKPLVVNKYTKSGEKDIDISPSVFDVEAAEGSDGKIEIDLMIYSENGSFLNPEYLITALKDKLGILSGDLLKNKYSVIRRCIYDENKNVFM